MNKTPKNNHGLHEVHRKYMVQMTFLVSVSIKLKMQTLIYIYIYIYALINKRSLIIRRFLYETAWIKITSIKKVAKGRRMWISAGHCSIHAWKCKIHWIRRNEVNVMDCLGLSSDLKPIVRDLFANERHFLNSSRSKLQIKRSFFFFFLKPKFLNSFFE